MLCLIQIGPYKYKLNAQSLRLIGLHSDVNDAYRADANRLQNKTKISVTQKKIRKDPQRCHNVMKGLHS